MTNADRGRQLLEMTSDEGVPLEQIEDTVSIDARHEVVFTHLTEVEGLRITDAVTSDWRGGRALVLVAPDAAGGSTLTMMADAPAASEAGAEMRVRMRHQLERVAATLEGQAAGETDGPSFGRTDDSNVVETGLDAIEEDQTDGVREAPFANDPSHRP